MYLSTIDLVWRKAKQIQLMCVQQHSPASQSLLQTDKVKKFLGIVLMILTTKHLGH